MLPKFVDVRRHWHDGLCGVANILPLILIVRKCIRPDWFTYDSDPSWHHGNPSPEQKQLVTIVSILAIGKLFPSAQGEEDFPNYLQSFYRIIRTFSRRKYRWKKGSLR